MMNDKRTAAAVLVDTLAAHGVERIYCVPGESYLAVLDALHARRDSWRQDLRAVRERLDAAAGA